LLAINVFGNETTVPMKSTDSFIDSNTDSQAAVAADGSYIIARVDQISAGDHPTINVTASRYTANGKLLGTMLLDSYSQATSFASSDVSVSMDANGDAVVAYSE